MEPAYTNKDVYADFLERYPGYGPRVDRWEDASRPIHKAIYIWIQGRKYYYSYGAKVLQPAETDVDSLYPYMSIRLKDLEPKTVYVTTTGIRPETPFEKYIKERIKERIKDKMLTVGDMVDELKKQGFPDTKAIDRKDVDGKHYVEFMVRKGNWTVCRKLYEYNIGSMSMIQQNRRYFLEEIVETFRKHEEEEREALHLPNLKQFAKTLDIPAKVLDYDIRDMYPETMYVSDIIQNIINQKEKEKEMSNCIDRVKWKVGSVTFDRRSCGDVKNTLSVELKARPIAGYEFGSTGPREIEIITDALEKRLNGNDDDYKRLVNSVYGYRPSAKLPAIEKVIFNAPATIVFWKDGSDKTVVKTQNGEAYDPEKGLAMAIVKKALGNEGKYFNEIKKWVGDNESESESKKYVKIGECIAEGFTKARDRINALASSMSAQADLVRREAAVASLTNALNNKKVTKDELKAVMEHAIRTLGGVTPDA